MRVFSLFFVVLVAMLVVMVSQPAVADPDGSTPCSMRHIRLSTLKHSNPFTLLDEDIEFQQVFTESSLLEPLDNSSVRLTVSMAHPSAANGFIAVYYNATDADEITNNPLVSQWLANQSSTSYAAMSFSKACGLSNVIAIKSVYDWAVSFQNPKTKKWIPNYYSCKENFIIYVNNPECPGVHGDPQFAGLRGQSFQVHGIDGAVYSLISAPSYLVNARFEFLDGPRDCPVMPTTGVKSAACWTHPGSYLGAIGVLTTSGDALIVESGPASVGFSSVTLNGKPLAVLDSSDLAGQMGSVVRNSTHELTINVGSFSIEVENSDGFLNLRAVRVFSSQWQQLSAGHVHGLLGQTWQSRRYGGPVKEIEGDIDDYVIADNSLIGKSFIFSRFNAVSA